MALPATVVWECRASGASDNNGGGFVAGATGTDFSQQNAAQASGTDLAVDAVTNTKVTSATHNFVASDVGNLMQITAGVGYTTGFYQIVSVAANAATLDRSPGAVGVTGGTWAVGGALATLGKLAGAMVASNLAWANGSFTASASVTFSQSVTPSGATSATKLNGYGTVRGDTGHATLTLQTNTGLTGINATGTGFQVNQLDVNCAILGTSIGISIAGAQSNVTTCVVSNFTSIGISTNGVNDVVRFCELTGGTSAASVAIFMGTNGFCANNYVHGNACAGIKANDRGIRLKFNLIVNNSGASSDGIQTFEGVSITNNTLHGNGRDGIRSLAAAYGGSDWVNNVITNNGGFGILGSNGAAIPAQAEWDGNAFFGNTSGTRSLMDSVTGIYAVNPYTNVRDVILTASPYVGPTSGGSENFGLNLVAGGGAACRQAGIPGAFPGLATTVGYPDMGAVQARDTGGSHFIG